MAKATHLNVLARNSHGDEHRSQTFQLTAPVAEQRSDLRDIVNMKTFEVVETRDHGLSISLVEFLEAIADAQHELSVLASRGDQFAIDLLEAVADIREFTKHDRSAMAFVSVD